MVLKERNPNTFVYKDQNVNAQFHYQNTRKHDAKSSVTKEKKQDTQNLNQKELVFTLNWDQLSELSLSGP